MCRRASEDARELPRPPVLRAPAREPVIAVDAMGGDYAPDEIVAGALAAQREHGLTTLLTGPPARLRPVIARLGGGSELRVVPAEDVGRDGRGRPGRLPAAPVEHRRRLPARPARPGERRRLRRVDGRDRGQRQAPAAAAARRAAPRPGRPAADPSQADRAHRRGRDRRPQAGDARAVRPPGRRVRADRARHPDAQGRAAHHRRGAGQGQRADPPGARAARRRAAAAARCRCTSRATSRAAT